MSQYFKQQGNNFDFNPQVRDIRSITPLPSRVYMPLLDIVKSMTPKGQGKVKELLPEQVFRQQNKENVLQKNEVPRLTMHKAILLVTNNKLAIDKENLKPVNEKFKNMLCQERLAYLRQKNVKQPQEIQQENKNSMLLQTQQLWLNRMRKEKNFCKPSPQFEEEYVILNFQKAKDKIQNQNKSEQESIAEKSDKNNFIQNDKIQNDHLEFMEELEYKRKTRKIRAKSQMENNKKNNSEEENLISQEIKIKNEMFKKYLKNQELKKQQSLIEQKFVGIVDSQQLNILQARYLEKQKIKEKIHKHQLMFEAKFKTQKNHQKFPQLNQNHSHSQYSFSLSNQENSFQEQENKIKFSSDLQPYENYLSEFKQKTNKKKIKRPQNKLFHDLERAQSRHIIETVLQAPFRNQIIKYEN